MRVLVATNHLQGSTDGDYAHTVEGELLLVEVAECDRPEQCGCGRGWPGIASHRATTTAMVVDLPHLTEDDLRQAVLDWLTASGWADLFRDAAEVDAGTIDPFHDVEEMLSSMVDEHIELITEVCESFPTGTVLERRGSVVTARSWPTAA